MASKSILQTISEVKVAAGSPARKVQRKEEEKVPPSLKGDFKALAEFFNKTLESKLDAQEAKFEMKFDEINSKVMVAAQATDEVFKELFVDREKTKKDIEEIKGRFDLFEKHVKDIPVHAGNAFQRSSRSEPPPQSNDPMVKIVGFNPGTFKEDLEQALDTVIEQVGIEIDKANRFCPGRRSDYGLIKFDRRDVCGDFLKKT